MTTEVPAKESTQSPSGAEKGPKRVLEEGFLRISSILRKASETSIAFTDGKKALTAAVLPAVLITVFTGVAILQTQAKDRTSALYSIYAAGAVNAAEKEASAVVAKSANGVFAQAAEMLEKKVQQKAGSLRRQYMDILDRGEGDSFIPETEVKRRFWKELRAQRKKELSEDPYLLLVNKWHHLPEDYETEPVTLPNGQMIGSECYEPLMDMLEDCREAGGVPIVCSGYRPHDKQVYLFGEQINRWIYSGYEQDDAEDLASTAVAVPGTSEHELGLAADIYSSENMSLDESQIYSFTQQWLMENCWRYGFILRYPKDKSDITGIIFEPWHYRYVGLKHARKIHKAGICLEEYLDQADHTKEEEERVAEEDSDRSDSSDNAEKTDDSDQADRSERVRN